MGAALPTPEPAAEGVVAIESEGDIVSARRAARDVVTALGFGLTDTTRVVTAVSELARNVFLYARVGVMQWRTLREAHRTGVELVFEDHGPGIPDLEQAMTLGYSSGAGLGMGLPGARRLMDELTLESRVGEGTRVVIRKWRRN
jgi:serine/threonine-protein kinase RsbT